MLFAVESAEPFAEVVGTATDEAKQAEVLIGAVLDEPKEREEVPELHLLNQNQLKVCFVLY